MHSSESRATEGISSVRSACVEANLRLKWSWRYDPSASAANSGTVIEWRPPTPAQPMVTVSCAGVGGRHLITVPELAAEALGSYLHDHLSRRFASTHADLTELIPSVARLSLECIGNSDALYHNVEHTMLVTLVGYDIMKGRALLQPTFPSDFAHMLVACLLHDIGYVRGILQQDGPDGYIIDTKGNKTKLPRGASDAALLPYHVDRS